MKNEEIEEEIIKIKERITDSFLEQSIPFSVAYSAILTLLKEWSDIAGIPFSGTHRMLRMVWEHHMKEQSHKLEDNEHEN